MDRNYVSLDFLAFLQRNNIKFLSRLNLGYYTKETENMKTRDEIVEKRKNEKKYFEDEETREYAKENKIEVRILKYVLKTGEEEYLITNLKEFSYEELFKTYYIDLFFILTFKFSLN